jgi:hypothetical protein
VIAGEKVSARDWESCSTLPSRKADHKSGLAGMKPLTREMYVCWQERVTEKVTDCLNGRLIGAMELHKEGLAPRADTSKMNDCPCKPVAFALMEAWKSDVGEKTFGMNVPEGVNEPVPGRSAV